MAGYPTVAGERRVRADDLQNVATSIFLACRMSPADAGLLAETLVWADVRGIHSHGTLRVPEYVTKFRRGGVDPRGKPRIAKDSGAAMVIDGGNAMGQIAGEFAMRQARARARETGVAAAAVRGSNHCGAMAWFATGGLSEDMIGLATTNAIPIMAPWGGCERVIGINPLAVAIPAGEEPPIVLDVSFSGSSHGKIRVYHQKGLPLPSGWAYDDDGHPTTDAARALTGLLQPIGGYKGTGLAIVMGILSSVLSGAAYGTELGNMVDGPRAGHDGHFFMALHVGAFEDPQRFKRRVDDIIRQIRGSRKAQSVDRIYAPGELEAVTEQDYRCNGIPLNQQTLGDIARTAEELDVDATSLQ